MDQTGIFYLIGERVDVLNNSPYVEGIIENDYEVIYMTDMVDEYIVDIIFNYKDIPLICLTREKFNVSLNPESEADYKEVEEMYKDVCKDCCQLLENQVTEVRISKRLIESPCCILNNIYGMSPNMERIVRSQENFKKSADLLNRKVFEINPNHVLIHALHEFHAESVENDSTIKRMSFENLTKLLYDTALLRGGIPLYRPNEFVENIYSMIAFSLDIKDSCIQDPEEISVHLPPPDEFASPPIDSSCGLEETLESSPVPDPPSELSTDSDDCADSTDSADCADPPSEFSAVADSTDS